MERNKLAIRENMRKSMDEIGATHTVCLPMSLDFVTFSELKDASVKDKGIIPFTGIDHTKEYVIPGISYLSFAFGPGFLGLSGRSSSRSSPSMKPSSPIGLPVRSCFLKRSTSDS